MARSRGNTDTYEGYGWGTAPDYACLSCSFLSRWALALLLDDIGFHPNAEVARIAGCKWWQDVRQQLLCAERADYTGWTSLCPAVLLFAVALCPAVVGRDVDCAFSVLHGASFRALAAMSVMASPPGWLRFTPTCAGTVASHLCPTYTLSCPLGSRLSLPPAAPANAPVACEERSLLGRITDFPGPLLVISRR